MLTHRLSTLSLIVSAFAAAELFLVAPALAQVSDPVVAAQAPRPNSGHDYIGGGIETVNPSDGTLSIHIPMRTPPGRQLSFPFGIRYNAGEDYYLTNQNGLTLTWELRPWNPWESSGWSYDLPILTATASILTYFPVYAGNGQLEGYNVSFRESCVNENTVPGESDWTRRHRLRVAFGISLG
jgi:hypothetical protein